MRETYSGKEKLALLAAVMWPILVTQVGLYMMNFIDTAMSGHAGAVDLAGVAVGSSLWIPILTGVSGILMALTPILAQNAGAGKSEKTAFYVQQGMWLAAGLTAAVAVLGFFLLDPVLALMDLEPEAAYIAKHYLIGLAAGMLPLFLYNALRGFIDSLGQTRTTMVITLLALPVNTFFNYVLIFGAFGFPELGGIGAGYASAITYWFIFSVTFYTTARVRPFSGFGIYRGWSGISTKAWKELLLLGMPIGLTIFFETSIFSAVTLLMSQYSTEVIAAHQAAVNFASLLYMIPLSFAFALTIAVGYEAGAERLHDADSYTKIGIIGAAVMGVAASVIIYLLREPAAFIYTQDPELAELITLFLLYAVFFQMSDAVNTPIQGVLRGYKDVNIPFLMALAAFWLIGLPSGHAAAVWTPLGPFGYWIGLIIGLTVCAAMLAYRLKIVRQRFRQARLQSN
ncbi:MATE family efflux transporter [Alkalicoccus luteus]|uniref:MATE family efflux transporter n=1 Tax=Alkalicoccus luteus TaxID=1237094 RepID=UPI004033A1D8